MREVLDWVQLEAVFEESVIDRMTTYIFSAIKYNRRVFYDETRNEIRVVSPFSGVSFCVMCNCKPEEYEDIVNKIYTFQMLMI